jgi:hypothetical protein
MSQFEPKRGTAEYRAKLILNDKFKRLNDLVRSMVVEDGEDLEAVLEAVREAADDQGKLLISSYADY